MKVLMIGQSAYGNGIGTVIGNLYRSLHNRNICCDLAIFDEYNKDSEIVKYIRSNGDNIFRIPNIKSAGPIKYIRNVYKICKEGQYDVVHIHTSLLIFLSAYGAKKAGVKSIVGHAHGAQFLNYPKIVTKSLEVIGRKLNCKYCTALVGCSQVSIVYTFGKKGIWIPNYVPTMDILGVSEEDITHVHNSFNPENEKILFGYMGKLDALKNAIFIPDVIKQLQLMGTNANAYLMGVGKETNSIKEKAIRLGIGDQIHLLGYRDDCNLLIQAMDYYISGSKTEGMSLSMIEAQLSGKPVFASALIPDDSDLGIGLFHKIEGFDASAWAKVIHECIETGQGPISRQEAFSRAKKQGMTEDIIIDRLLEVYNCK